MIVYRIRIRSITYLSSRNQRLLSSSSRRLFTSYNNNQNNNIDSTNDNKSNITESTTANSKSNDRSSKTHLFGVGSILKTTLLLTCITAFFMYKYENSKRVNEAKHHILVKIANHIGLGLCLYLIGLNDEIMDVFNCEVNELSIAKGTVQLAKANKMGTTMRFIITNPEKSVYGEVTFSMMNIWSQSIHNVDRDLGHNVQVTVMVSDSYGTKSIVAFIGTSKDIDDMEPIIYPYYYFDENRERKPTKIKRDNESRVFMFFVADKT